MNNSEEHLQGMRSNPLLSTDAKAKNLEKRLKAALGYEWAVTCVPEGEQGEGGFRLSRPDGGILTPRNWRDLSDLYARRLGLVKLAEWPNARCFYFFPDELHIALKVG